jgi:hypothetical protein
MLALLSCATGSFVFKVVPDFFRYRLWGSWLAPQWHTVWGCSLFAIVAIWCLHAVLRLIDLVLHREAVRNHRRFEFTLVLAQLGFALCLGSYVAVVVDSPEEEFVVTDKGTTIHGEFYRALRVERSNLREASRRLNVVVWLERRVGTVSSELRLNRGAFWVSATGTHLLVVARARLNTDGAILRHGNRRVTLVTEKPVKEGGATLLLHRLLHFGHAHHTQAPRAELKIGSQETLVPLDPEWAGESALLGLKESPVVLLRAHRNLFLPLMVWATASLFVSAILWIFCARRGSETSP